MDCALTESGNCLVVCIVIAQQCEEEEENSKVKFLHNISFHHHSSQGRSDVFSIKPLKRSNKRNFTASISPLSCAVGNFLKRAEKYSATTEKYLGTQSSARARMCVCMHACKSAKDALFSIDCTKITVQMLIKHARIDWPPWVDVGINVSWVCFQPDLWHQTCRADSALLMTC